MAVISYRVQSSPGRDQARDRLLAGLPPAVEVIVDDGPPPASPWRGYQLCLTDPPDCTHLCLLQDDTVVCRNFAQALERVAQVRPDNPVCLFLGGVPMRTAHEATKALTNGWPFVPVHFRDFVPVVAILWPRECAVSFLDWSRTARLPGMPRPVRSDDAVCGLWMRESRTTVYATVPSLVQHPDDVESTIGKRAMAGADKGRVALHWIGDNDPLEINWA